MRNILQILRRSEGGLSWLMHFAHLFPSSLSSSAPGERWWPFRRSLLSLPPSFHPLSLSLSPPLNGAKAMAREREKHPFFVRLLPVSISASHPKHSGYKTCIFYTLSFLSFSASSLSTLISIAGLFIIPWHLSDPSLFLRVRGKQKNETRKKFHVPFSTSMSGCPFPASVPISSLPPTIKGKERERDRRRERDGGGRGRKEGAG